MGASPAVIVGLPCAGLRRTLVQYNVREAVQSFPAPIVYPTKSMTAMVPGRPTNHGGRHVSSLGVVVARGQHLSILAAVRSLRCDGGQRGDRRTLWRGGTLRWL